MRFILVDRIVEWEPGVSITTIKNLTMAEEYLAEHFPSFPVMPGVMMVEAITLASAWLIRLTEQYRHSVILLKEARTVKFGQFITPGRQLRVACEMVEDNGVDAVFKARGTLDGQPSVSAKVVLTRFNLADRDTVYQRDDRRLVARQRQAFHLLATPEVRRKVELSRAAARS